MRTTNFIKIYKSFKYKFNLNQKYQYNDVYKSLHDYNYTEHEFYVENLVRPFEKTTFSSNRVTYWKNVISNSKNPFWVMEYWGIDF